MINTFGQPSMNGHFGGFATPGGGTGAPLQAPDPRSGIVQSIMSRFGGPAFGGNPGGNFNISGFRDAMDQYRDSRPLIAPGTTADARQTQLQDWRATRPSPKSYF